jgi:hypothetical protein
MFSSFNYSPPHSFLVRRQLHLLEASRAEPPLLSLAPLPLPLPPKVIKRTHGIILPHSRLLRLVRVVPDGLDVDRREVDPLTHSPPTHRQRMQGGGLHGRMEGVRSSQQVGGVRRGRVVLWVLWVAVVVVVVRMEGLLERRRRLDEGEAGVGGGSLDGEKPRGHGRTHAVAVQVPPLPFLPFPSWSSSA